MTSPSATESTTLQWLGLIVDRTCPDRRGWSDARALTYGPPSDDSIIPGQPAYADYNRAVRDALATVLTQRFSSPVPFVHLAWFGDKEDAGLSAPEWIQPSMTSVGDFPACPADCAVENLRFCTYVPGLDLFDPLGEALELVAEPLLRQPRPGSAILLVGNSPPDLPVEGDSALYELLTFQGLETTARRRCHRFLPLLRELARQGVPIAYLFLVHDQHAAGEEENLLLYQKLESSIIAVLRTYFPVIRARADQEGIVQGFDEAIKVLHQPVASA